MMNQLQIMQEYQAALESEAQTVLAAQQLALEAGYFEMYERLGIVSMKQIRHLNEVNMHLQFLMKLSSKSFLQLHPALIGMN